MWQYDDRITKNVILPIVFQLLKTEFRNLLAINFSQLTVSNPSRETTFQIVKAGQFHIFCNVYHVCCINDQIYVPASPRRKTETKNMAVKLIFNSIWNTAVVYCECSAIKSLLNMGCFVIFTNWSIREVIKRVKFWKFDAGYRSVA